MGKVLIGSLFSLLLSLFLFGLTAQLVEKTALLEELNATKDKFFSIIAHDLRSPFSGIIGLLDLLLENKKDHSPEQTDVYLRCIKSSAQTTLDLLENLLDWAKLQTGQMPFRPEKIAIQDVILNVVEFLNSSARIKNISLVYHESTLQNLDIYGDPHLLTTVLRNLISNALKFTPLNGEVHIHTSLNQQ